MAEIAPTPGSEGLWFLYHRGHRVEFHQSPPATEVSTPAATASAPWPLAGGQPSADSDSLTLLASSNPLCEEAV